MPGVAYGAVELDWVASVFRSEVLCMRLAMMACQRVGAMYGQLGCGLSYMTQLWRSGLMDQR